MFTGKPACYRATDFIVNNKALKCITRVSLNCKLLIRLESLWRKINTDSFSAVSSLMCEVITCTSLDFELITKGGLVFCSEKFNANTYLFFSFTISWLYINGQTSFTLQAVSIIYCAARTRFFFQYLLQRHKKKQPPYYLFSQLGRALTNQAIFLQPLKQKFADNGPQHRFHVLIFTYCFNIYMSHTG